MNEYQKIAQVFAEVCQEENLEMDEAAQHAAEIWDLDKPIAEMVVRMALRINCEFGGELKTRRWRVSNRRRARLICKLAAIGAAERLTMTELAERAREMGASISDSYFLANEAACAAEEII